MPRMGWWAIIARLTEAAKLIRKFGQIRNIVAEPDAPFSRRPQTDSSSSRATLETEIEALTARLDRLEELLAQDNEITARLDQHLQEMATLLGKLHFQLRAGLMMAAAALLLALVALVWLAAK